MNDTNKKALKGVKWTSIQTIFVGIIGPLILVLQARFLSPKEMGYIAIIMIIIGLLQVVENMGLSQAIIQNEKFNNNVFSSLFIFNIILSIFVSLFLYKLAPILESYYGLDNLTYYIRLLIFLILIQSPSLVLRAVMQKELMIKPLSLIEILRNIGQVIALFIMFKFNFGVSSVVLSTIFGTLISTFCIAFYCFKNKLVKFSKLESLNGIIPYFKFGTIISFKQIFTYIVLRADELLIGLFLSPETLGFYHFAKNVLERVRNLVTASFSSVLFPFFSKLQNNKVKLSDAYNKVTEILSLIAFPMFTGISLTAHLFIPIIFGEEWLGSLVIFRIISIGLIPMLLTFSVATSLLYAVNKPGIVLKVDIITNSLYLVTLYFVAQIGTIAVAATYILFILIKSVYLQVCVNHSLRGNFNEYLSKLKAPFIQTIIMALVVIIAQRLVNFSSLIVMLLLSVFIGIIVYTALTWVFNEKLFKQVKKLILDKLSSSEIKSQI